MADRTAPEQIDDIIRIYGGWKGETLSRLRGIIIQADPDVVEEVKWKMATRPEGLPVWSHDGILCIAETFKDNIKLVFFKGARMKDQKPFNARLNSKTDRAIEFQEGSTVDEAILKKLILEAVELNKKA
jgi:hypothetical protein